MTAALLQARVGAGKTEIAQERILALKRATPLARIWVVLATGGQSIDFRRRLIERAGVRALFNIEFFEFYALYRHVLAGAGQLQRGISEIVRDELLRHVLSVSAAAGDLPIFRHIAETPGLARALGDFIYELKQNEIAPDVLIEAAARTTPKIREMAAVYARYQALLRHHRIVDREGEGWLALVALSDLSLTTLATDVDLLIVDGYDQFNRVQARLLAALAVRAKETIITLTAVDPALQDTVGRRFMRARLRLEQEFDRQQVDLAVEAPAPREEDTRPAALRHLTTHLLRYSPPMLPDTGGALHFIEAPDPAREANAVIRRIKRTLLNGARPDDVLIALRDYARYAPLLAAAAERAGVPLALHYGDPASSNPAVVALLDLIALHALDFRRHETLDVLRSPYFAIPGLDSASVDALEAVTTLVIAGREEWIAALDAAAVASAPEREDEDTLSLFPTQSANFSAIKGALMTFFDAITPPASGMLTDYAGWLDDLIGVDAPERDDGAPEDIESKYSLGMPDRIRAESGSAPADLGAMKAVKRRLGMYLQAEALFRSLKIDHPRSRAGFGVLLRAVVEAAAVDPHEARTGRVLVTTANDARGLPHAHVFILGISEGMFPAPPPEDRLLLESERATLIAAGVEIGLRSERADDEGVFFELINLAAQSLTLSRPYTADGGVLPPSHLWRSAAGLFAALPITRLALGEYVAPEDAAALEEAAVVAAEALTSAADVARRGVYRWIQTAQRAYWAHIAAAHQREAARIGGRVEDGRLSEAQAVALAEKLVHQRAWSATQLNELGTCAYRFFAHRLLKLEAPKTPEMGMDVLQRGSLLHEILERVYQQIADGEMPIDPENSETAVALLYAAADSALATAPARYGFRPSATWTREQSVIRRKLEALVRADFSADAPFGAGRHVYAVEQAFDAALPLLSGETLRVRGLIDRIDQHGDHFYLIDYKSGSSEAAYKLPQLQRGRNVQLWVYLLAAEHALRIDTARAAFWHIPNRKVSGSIAPDTAEAADAIAGARARLTAAVGAARRGDFAAEPNGRERGRCAAHCDYAKLCRIAVRARGRGDDAGA